MSPPLRPKNYQGIRAIRSSGLPATCTLPVACPRGERGPLATAPRVFGALIDRASVLRRCDLSTRRRRRGEAPTAPP